MPIDTKRVQQYLRAYNLKDLFREELGWDNLKMQPIDMTVNNTTFELSPIAEKRGFQVFACSPDADGKIPDSTTRAKIERVLTPLAYQHLIVFADAQGTTQTWQWARREANLPVAIRQETFVKNVKEDLLIQKLDLLFVSIDEEEALTGIDVESKAKKAFDVEKVTKKFYERFKTEHGAFLKFISGIQGQGDREWYASLMLNRLMFVYFIQKKGFLDGDRNYLLNRLKIVQSRRGKGQFLSFYRQFLLRLFHEGLNKPDRASELQQLIGKVPYLNGGLFDVHQLEQDNTDLDIPDEAFERIFDFFDDYDWHLDERPLRRDNEINPDVLGYIFEKYINQKQMGAYYTKEDITEYISKNTIIPFLFDAADKDCTIAFQPNSALWNLLREQPDRYIYEAVRKGTDIPLPATIQAGIEDVAKRDGWNRPADAAVALPTETWREQVARRQRYEEIRAKLAAGDVRTINDLITYNLDIRQFAQDAIQNSEGPELLRAFYKAIQRLTVLDPTCGSGAFLFAALNILEPLYEACLERMQAFVDDLDRSNQPHSPTKFEDFRTILERVKEHPNRRYFILKSIILNNLYGVDIMEEAVEICKLRLFLKLAAQVEPDTSAQNYGIEPLPDIDFNIRAGNTLVGFATYDDVKRALTAKMDFDNAMPEIEETAEIVSRAFKQFRDMQTKRGMAAKDFAEAKQELRQRLNELDEKLNRYLALEYGVYAAKKADFEQWKQTHQPFHWFVEFYNIISSGGFDIVIGNPPYVSARKLEYSFPEMRGSKFSDIYAHVLIRSLVIAKPTGRQGMIVPLSLTFSEDFGALRKSLTSAGYAWLSSYDNIPAAVFAGVSQRCTIWIGAHSREQKMYVTPMYRWRSSYRAVLTDNIAYSQWDKDVQDFGVPKLSDNSLRRVLVNVIDATRTSPSRYIPGDRTGQSKIGFSQAARNFISVFLEEPPCLDEQTLQPVPPSKIGFVKVKSEQHALASLAMLSSDVYFWYWLVRGDGFDITGWVISDFLKLANGISGEGFTYLACLGEVLQQRRYEALVFKKNAGKYVGNYNFRWLSSITRRADLLILAEVNVERKEALALINYVQRVLAINEYAGEKSIPSEVKNKYTPKPITDKQKQSLAEIDQVLAKHYGFTPDELDFIINYDLKNRIVQKGEDEE